MALISCNTCDSEIAKSAKTCPQCGAKTPSAVMRSQIWGIIFALIFFGLFVAMLV